jgi:hypothetical protein
VLVLTAQGAALVGVAAYLTVRAFGHDAHNRGLAFLDVGATLAGAALLLGLARGLSRLRLAARTPALVVEALCVPVGVGLFQGDQPAYGGVVLGGAVAVIVLLLAGLPPAADRR